MRDTLTMAREAGAARSDKAITAIKQARADIKQDLTPVQEPALVVYQGEIAKSTLPKGFTGVLYIAPPAQPAPECIRSQAERKK